MERDAGTGPEPEGTHYAPSPGSFFLLPLCEFVTNEGQITQNVPSRLSIHLCTTTGIFINFSALATHRWTLVPDGDRQWTWRASARFPPTSESSFRRSDGVGSLLRFLFPLCSLLTLSPSCCHSSVPLSNHLPLRVFNSGPLDMPARIPPPPAAGKSSVGMPTALRRRSSLYVV